MSAECAWCGRIFDPEEIGLVRITELPPINEGLDAEGYNFCQYKCLKRWVNL